MMAPMTTVESLQTEQEAAAQDATHADACYLALKARDARFDGRFFIGVTSTHIYCRPVCKVRIPKRENCRFFDLAAQAEGAGFRPCLRCRPELAPQSAQHALPGSTWSVQDASALLALEAARLLDDPERWTSIATDTHKANGGPLIQASAVEQLSQRLGVSSRHVRRIFEAHLGVSPLQYLQTRRLLTAKQLLTDTALPVTQIAHASGFASLRRFNAAFMAHYRLNPTALRKQSLAPIRPIQPTSPMKPMKSALANPHAHPGTRVRLGYRPPYDVPAMLAFWTKRRIDAIENVADDGHASSITRTIGLRSSGKTHAGWLRAEFDEPNSQVVLHVSDSLLDILPLVIRRVRNWLDLDADPAAIHATLGGRFPEGAGLRVPGCLDGFELAVRAVLGQQITVAAARTLAQRMVDTLGEPIDTPFDGLTRLFPTVEVLAQASGDSLGRLGIVRQRQAAIVAIAQAVVEGRISLHAGADVPATMAALKALPGIGDWTAHYIAMRALRWPDAFPAGDIALHKALGLDKPTWGTPRAAKALELMSQDWKPWRSYAVLRAWALL